MNVKLQIYFKAQDGKTYKRVINYANPEASDTALNNFVAALYSLTTNDLQNVLKVVNTFLDDESQPETEITADDIASIFDGTFVRVEDEDGITQVDINAVFNETYTPAEDSGGISQSDINALFANW